MANIDVFFTAEHIAQVSIIEADPKHTIEVIQAEVRRRHGGEETLLVFLEDSDEPLEATVVVEELAKKGPVKVHLHRCRHVEVAVTYNGKTVKHPFGPGTTIARIKRWAAEKLGIGPGDASELLLQIHGTTDRPSLSTHVGTLVKCPHCAIAFDFVTNVKVNG